MSPNINVIPKWMRTTSPSPDTYAMHTDMLARLTVANWLAFGLGLTALSGGSILPKEYRPYALGGVFGTGALMSLIGASQRTLRSRLDLIATGEVNAYEGNLTQNLTLGASVANTYQARESGKLTAELQAQQHIQKLPPSTPIGVTPDTVKFFDINSLRLTGGDDFKHVLVLAPTGSGKTTLLSILSEVLQDEYAFQVLLSPHQQKEQFPLVDIKVGMGGNYGDFNEASRVVPKDADLGTLFQLNGKGASKNIPLAHAWIMLDNEYKLRETKYIDNVYRPVTYIFCDEWREQAQHFNNTDHFNSITTRFITGARKLFMRCFFFTTIANARSIGWDGEAGLKSNFTNIYLGSDADQRVNELVTSGQWDVSMLQWWNKKQERMGLVDDMPFIIPEHSINSSAKSFEVLSKEVNEEQESHLIDEETEKRNAAIQAEYDHLRSLKIGTPSQCIKQVAKANKMTYQEAKAIINTNS